METIGARAARTLVSETFRGARDYDGSSGLIGATDLGGHRWSYTYEPIMAGEVSFDVESGRVSLSAPDGEPSVYRFSGGCPFQDAEQLVREAAGAWQHALGTVTSPMGEVTRYGYDTEGHRISTTLPSGGVHAMTYAEGHLDTETLPYGTTLAYSRDAAFRERTRTGSDGSFRAFTYGPGDRVQTIEDDTGVTAYAYDAAGRFAGLDYPTGGSVHLGRDALDQITTVAVQAPADASARTTTYVRDAANRITEIHDPLGGVTVQTYDANGRLSTRTLPNGITSTWTYDARSRVDTIVHARADHSVLASLDYDRNPSGEPFRITREDGTFVMYGYDSALRLTSERYFDATRTQVDAISYTYDDDGNRTTRTTSAGTETYHYTSGSQLTDITMGATTIAHYDYDDAGRVVHRTRGAVEQQLDYDVDDHLVRVADPAGTHEVVWDFDAAGRRVRREDRTAGVTTGVSRFEIAPTLDESLESPHAVTTDAGVAETGYVFAGEHPLFRYDASTGEVVYYLQDSMGSVVGLVDGTGVSASTITYDGFGNELGVTGALAGLPGDAQGDFRFQGMWRDAGTGMYYVRARMYETLAARFLSRDAHPARLAPFSYGAFDDNPNFSSDATGQFSLSELVETQIVQRIVVGMAVGMLSGFIRHFRRFQCSGYADFDGYFARVSDESLWGGASGLFSALFRNNRDLLGPFRDSEPLRDAATTFIYRLPRVLFTTLPDTDWGDRERSRRILVAFVQGLVSAVASDFGIGGSGLEGWTNRTALVNLGFAVADAIWQQFQTCEQLHY